MNNISMAQVLKAYDYANDHPHKYLRGTTNWCAAVAHSLNAQAADSRSDLLAALIAITSSGPDAIPIKEAFEMAHRAIERASGGKV